jgi:hypothetical protein
LETTNAASIALSGDRIGYQTGGGNFWVKEGTLSAGWTLETNNATLIALT